MSKRALATQVDSVEQPDIPAESPPVQERTGLVSTWDPAILDRLETETIELFGYRFKLLSHERIGRKIADNGIYENAQTRLIPAMLNLGGAFLDVGANIGYYTMWLARLSMGRGSVHSFEPNPLPFAILSENVRANGIGNVHINNVAVGRTGGEMMIDLGLTLPDANVDARDYNLGGWSLARKKKGEHQVRVVSIDEYVEEKRVHDVRFVKIDVEGFERMVLAGAADTLKRDKPIIMIEMAAPNAKRRDQIMHILEFLRVRKYNLGVVESRPIPHLRRLRESDIAGETFRFYAFAIRKDLGFLGE